MTMSDEVQFVVFQAGGRDFALEITQVERILQYEEPLALPKSPAFLEGVLTHGASVVPVVDLRRRLEVEAPIDEQTRIMIVEAARQRIGIIVDRVLEVVRIDSPTISAPPPLVQGLAAAFIAGIFTYLDRAVVILNAARFFTSKERITLAEAAADAC